MINIYFAHPIANVSIEEKSHIKNIKDLFLRFNCKLYDPEDLVVPNAWGINSDEWSQCVFMSDVQHIDECDWVVALDYGRKTTGGTSWEVGYAFGKGKKILDVQMKSDVAYSVMVKGCSTNIVTYEDLMKLSATDLSNILVERGRINKETENKYN